MAEWRLDSYDRYRKLLGTLPHSNLQGEFFGSKPDQIRFDVPLRHPMVSPTTLSAGINEIWAYRNNKLVYAGPLWDMDINDSRISCTSEGLESYFETRRIQNDVSYNVGRGSIVMDMINKSQLLPEGQLGIVAGKIDTVPALAIKYWGNEGRYIADTIQELSEEGQFDYEIDSATRAVNITYPKKSVTSRSRLIYPGSITNYQLQINGKWALNDIFVRGNGTFRNPVIDTTRRTKYGLRQGTMTNSNLKSVTQLSNWANGLIDLHKEARWVPTLTIDPSVVNPFEGDISYGEIIRVVINEGWIDFDGQMRLSGWQVTVDKSGAETFNLYMNDVREVEETV